MGEGTGIAWMIQPQSQDRIDICSSVKAGMMMLEHVRISAFTTFVNKMGHIWEPTNSATSTGEHAVLKPSNIRLSQVKRMSYAM